MLAGDVQGGLEWLRLADLRGSSDLAAVGSALRGLVEQDTAAVDDLEPRIRTSWTAEIEACRRALSKGAPSRP
jgi:hypothetical protein